MLTNLNITPFNIAKLSFTAIMIASKVWDDVSCSSKSFAMCSSLFDLHELNKMEIVFCAILEFKLLLEA